MIVLPQLVMLFSLTGAGVFLRKKGVFADPVVRSISDIVTLVANPALLLSATQHQYTPESLNGFLGVLGIGTFTMAFGLIAVFFAMRRQNEKLRPIIAFLAVMPNSGFMGLPIVEAVYGDLGVLYLAAFIVAFNLVIWTIGIAFLEGRSFSIKRMLNPGFVAAVVGTVLFVLKVDFPEIVDITLDSMGVLNTPLAMMMLGARLTSLKPKALLDAKNAWVTGTKLIGMPILALMLAKGFSLDPVASGTLVLLSAMPSGVMSQMLAEQYDRDAVFAAQEISFTSILSMLTIPIVTILLGV